MREPVPRRACDHGTIDAGRGGALAADGVFVGQTVQREVAPRRERCRVDGEHGVVYPKTAVVKTQRAIRRAQSDRSKEFHHDGS